MHIILVNSKKGFMDYLFYNTNMLIYIYHSFWFHLLVMISFVENNHCETIY